MINAIRLPEGNMSDDEIVALHNHLKGNFWECGPNKTLIIYSAKGAMQAYPGDWIIRDRSGQCYPCKPEIFAPERAQNLASFLAREVLRITGRRVSTARIWKLAFDVIAVLELPDWKPVPSGTRKRSP